MSHWEIVLGLKTFLITEELKVSHAERYLNYVDRYHNEVFHDLKKNLSEEWEKAVKLSAKTHKVHPESKQAAILRNPKASVQISLSNIPTKIITSRSSVPIEVVPSVKIPLVYSEEECVLISKDIMSAAKKAMIKTIHGWSEIFNYEKKGRIQPWFKIIDDNEEVRMQLAITNGDHESFKTIYAIRTEYGKAGSKLKDFNRIYLINLIK